MFADGELCTLCALALHGLSSPVLDISRRLFNLNFCLMAIINSLAIGKSVKSAGNLTYKTVRGRTIASQRITQNKSNTPFQQNQRQLFAKVSESMKLLQQYIDACYEKSKYGSSRNAFFSTNKRFTLGNLVGEITEGIITLSDGMLSALTDTPTPQLSIITKGSLAGFLQIQYTTIPSYKYGENTYNNLRVIGDAESYGSGEYSFTLSKLARRTDIKLAFFGFADDGLISAFGDVNEDGLAHFDNTQVQSAVASSAFTFSDETNEFVSSMRMSCTINMVKNGKCPIGIYIPIIGGQVPTITAVFADESAV